MAQQVLHRPDVRTGLKQVSRKAVTQRMRNRIFSQANAINHHLEEVSEIVFTHMMPPQFTAARVHRQTLRRKDPLPAKLLRKRGQTPIAGTALRVLRTIGV